MFLWYWIGKKGIPTSIFWKKIENKMIGWKSKLLNLAGGATLIQTALYTIPLYFMKTNWLPQCVCDAIDQKARTFLWDNNKGDGMHLLN